jgi:hypothetical protein
MSSAPQIIELPDVRERFSRIVAVGIVVATLATAAVTYLLTAAGHASNAADVRAQRLAVDAMADTLRSQQTAQVRLEDFIKAQEALQLSSNAIQESVFAQPRDRPRLELEAARARNVAARLYHMSSIRLDGPKDPSRIRHFRCGCLRARSGNRFGWPHSKTRPTRRAEPGRVESPGTRPS